MDEIRWEPSTTASKIGVTATAGVVTLTGSVSTYAEKWAAERAAERVEGVKGVAADIAITPFGDHTKTDTEIAAAAVNALKWNVWVPSGVQATVAQGRVTLKGQATWEFERTAAGDAVRHMPGVKGVQNDIALKSAVQPKAVKEQIEKALVRSAKLDASGVKVTAAGGAVTLSGSVRTFSEKDAAGSAAWNAPGVTTVANEIAVTF